MRWPVRRRTIARLLLGAALLALLGPVSLRLWADRAHHDPQERAEGVGSPTLPPYRLDRTRGIDSDPALVPAGGAPPVHDELRHASSEPFTRGHATLGSTLRNAASEDLSKREAAASKGGEAGEGRAERGRSEQQKSGDPSAKIDWHDYNLMDADSKRKGPGEQGAPVESPAAGVEEGAELYKANGFNARVSELIATDRALPDIRHPQCKDKLYPARLPSVSVVLPFHNEHAHTLLRSVRSVLRSAPPALIADVILVDDCSTLVNLKQPLDAQLAVAQFGPKVKVVRLSAREGLIRARLAGARAARGDVIVFLDSHIEANVNWLPPLLEPLVADYRTVVCPFIDIIDMDTFAYHAQDEGRRGAFDWQLYYKRLPLLPQDLLRPAEPFSNPVMAGGLFAITARWFWELGGYDPGLEVWGGEQYELSFKIWMCGGRMLDAPCSRVGHVYRKFNPHGAGSKGNYVMRNHKRVVEVWLDEYAQHVYARNDAYASVDAGDLSAQRALRARLACKPFRWFIDEVAFDLPHVYPMIEPEHTAQGELRSLAGSADLCLDTKHLPSPHRVVLDKCLQGGGADLSGEQSLELTWRGDVRPVRRAVCLDVSQSVQRAPVLLFNCHNARGNQWWKYNVDTQQLLHVPTNTCLDCDTERSELFTAACDPRAPSQRWRWARLNETIARSAWTEQHA